MTVRPSVFCLNYESYFAIHSKRIMTLTAIQTFKNFSQDWGWLPNALGLEEIYNSKFMPTATLCTYRDESTNYSRCWYQMVWHSLRTCLGIWTLCHEDVYVVVESRRGQMSTTYASSNSYSPLRSKTSTLTTAHENFRPCPRMRLVPEHKAGEACEP
jgi:hypothetical protein